MKSITITNKELLFCNHGLMEISRLSENGSVPAVTSYKISKLVQALLPEVHLMQSQTENLMKKHNISIDENGNPSGNEKEYMEEYNELLSLEIEVSLTDSALLKLTDLSPLPLSVKTMMSIDKFIVE